MTCPSKWCYAAQHILWMFTFNQLVSPHTISNYNWLQRPSAWPTIYTKLHICLIIYNNNIRKSNLMKERYKAQTYFTKRKAYQFTWHVKQPVTCHISWNVMDILQHLCYFMHFTLGKNKGVAVDGRLNRLITGTRYKGIPLKLPDPHEEFVSYRTAVL